MKQLIRSLILCCSLVAGTALTAESTFDPALCADSYDKSMVRDYYRVLQPGAPPPIPGRDLALVETKIVSGLPQSESIGTLASREIYEQIWKTIDTWGGDNWITLVLTVDGFHAWAFPSQVPVTRTPAPEAFYDMYAQGDDGVHAHINPDHISMIYAVRVRAANGEYLRAVNFYGENGHLVVGVYATEPLKQRATQVVEGFEQTWNAIEALPRACQK